MSSFTVPDGCTGVELPNGKKIDANRQGHIVIDDARDERSAAKSVFASNGVLSRTALGFGHVKGNSASCSSCIFTGWKWQTICPKCGSEMIQETETE